MRWIFRVFVVLVILAGIAAAGAYVAGRASLPQLSGEIAVARPLAGPVRIVRDRHAIPHIFAANRDDAAFGLGYVHAQDRLWQLEINRRIGAGRLSELFGPKALNSDKFLRVLGFRTRAAKAFGALKPETRAFLEAYAAGVNAFLENRSGPLPPEFLILGIEPEPWTPTDSLTWLKIMSLDLSGNWGNELARLGLAQRLSKEQIEEFFPPYPGDAPVALADLHGLYRQVAGALDLPALTAALPPPPTEGIGSNNWVVSGAHTVTGAPLLANDPHLGLTTPAIWYFAHMALPDSEIIGASLPGVPGIVLGHNGRIAWGFTNTGPDTQDLYIEKIDPADPNRYLTPDGNQPFAIREEVLKVKGEADVVLRVRETRHGPVISDVVENARRLAGTDFAISMAWTALRDDDTTADALIGLDGVRDWNGFVENFRNMVTPQQNIVYADKAGNIGFLAPGLIPRRKPENDTKGLSPAPGWDARYDWDGFVPFDELPRVYNPASGRVVTANHKIVPDGYPHHLTSEWTEPYRARRIEQMLQERRVHSVESFKAVQGDVLSLMVTDILPLMLDAPRKSGPRNSDLAAAHSLMAAWDGSMPGNRAEPLIFQAWYRELTRLVLADELGPGFRSLWRHRPILMHNILANVGGQSRWCNNAETGQAQSCAGLIAEALDLALDDLKARYGSDMSRWRWGDAHASKSAHRPFSEVPPLRRVFEASVPTPGDTFTVNVGRHALSDDKEPFANNHAASLRAIYDLANLDRSVFVHSTGQSGHPLSANYRDFAQPWASVLYVPMTTRRADIEAGALGTLVLKPR